MSTENGATSTTNVAGDRIAIKIPPFRPTDPKIWFYQFENQFTIAGIVNGDTKFHYVVTNLDVNYITEVPDIIVRPPEIEKYNKLKTELIKRLSLSHE